MATGTAAVDIAKNPDEVWKVVAAFGEIDQWMPGIDACDLEGDVRSLQTMGVVIKEQLRELDDKNRRLTYGIVDSPLSLQTHVATISVNAAGGGSHVTWDVEVEPDDMLAMFQPVYQQGLDTLKKHVEG